jgi:hypothetical protein
MVLKPGGVAKVAEAVKVAAAGINLARGLGAIASAQSAGTRSLMWLASAALTRTAQSVGRR